MMEVTVGGKTITAPVIGGPCGAVTELGTGELRAVSDILGKPTTWGYADEKMRIASKKLLDQVRAGR